MGDPFHSDPRQRAFAPAIEQREEPLTGDDATRLSGLARCAAASRVPVPSVQCNHRGGQTWGSGYFSLAKNASSAALNLSGYS